MAKSPTAQNWDSEPIDIGELNLDPKNPRLTDFGLARNATQDQIIEALWSKMAVDELALSIAENGFYKHEPLYAAREHGKLFVIEGNRRLAAVKLLSDSALRSRLKVTGLSAPSDSNVLL